LHRGHNSPKVRFMDPSFVSLGAALILTAGLSALAWIDFKTGYLPDVLQIALAICALIVIALGSPVGIGWTTAIIGACVNSAVFWLLRWVMTAAKGREAMGLGDVKLVAVGGLWLGPWALPYIMALAGLSTLLCVGAAAVILRRPTWRGEIPLGPGLALGILAAYAAALAGMTSVVDPMRGLETL
jgi:leader peptidase (prepilin peptidase)/N-methyltransferase